MKMLKRLRVISISTVLVILLSLSSSCSPTDSLGSDLYTWGVFPSKTSTYDLGSYWYRWRNAYFNNIDVSNTLTLGGIDFSSANISGSGGNITNVTATLPITSTGGTTPDIGLDYDVATLQVVGGDLGVIPNLYVPYNGATDNVDLGVYSILTTGISGFIAYGDIFTDRWISEESNTFFGESVVGGDSVVAGAQNNSIYGHNAGFNLEDGQGNTISGSHALNEITTGDRNVSIGFLSGNNVDVGTGNVFLGTAAGSGLNVSNQLFIHNSETATPLIWGDFSADEVIINDDLYVTNTATIGSSLFADTVNITGTVWEDLRTPVTQLRVPSVKAPTWTAYRGSQVLAFSDQAVAGNEEEVYLAIQMAHEYKEGTDLYIHPHFVYSANQTNTSVRWGLSYTWADLDVKFPTETTIYATSLLTNDDADIHRFTSFASINGAGKTISSILLLKFFRNSSHASDNYTDDVYLLDVDAHYLIDASGSSQQWGK